VVTSFRHGGVVIMNIEAPSLVHARTLAAMQGLGRNHVVTSPESGNVLPTPCDRFVEDELLLLRESSRS
jgi:hypothetical protein